MQSISAPRAVVRETALESKSPERSKPHVWSRAPCRRGLGLGVGLKVQVRVNQEHVLRCREYGLRRACVAAPRQHHPTSITPPARFRTRQPPPTRSRPDHTMGGGGGGGAGNARRLTMYTGSGSPNSDTPTGRPTTATKAAACETSLVGFGFWGFDSRR